MNTKNTESVLLSVCLIAFLCLPVLASASGQEVTIPGVEIRFDSHSGTGEQTAGALKVVLGLTLLAMAPGIVVAMTSFTRIVVVFAMLRHALGLQDTPPNSVLISLALFLTVFIMSPVIERIDQEAFQPFSENRLSTGEAIRRGAIPLKDFMIRQTREQDLALMAEVANQEPPTTVEDVKFFQLVPAYMLSELKSAFQIGFMIFLPFLVVDLVVSSVLMALGMMMVPPTVISLPLKILLFVLIDGWNLVIRAVTSSFA